MVERQASIPISKAARNERRKAVATTCNAMAVALIVSAGLQPLMAGHFNLLNFICAGVAFIALQAVLHYVLRALED
jgi:hypothetical protein